MSDDTRIRADFSQRHVVPYEEVAWTPSPVAGVDRKMLDRIGDEVARATSIVRYAPGSSFDEHEHGGGEEIFVLEGVFSDESGDYPAGTYLRNPPGSRHAPGSEPGCTIFVKLRQFDPNDARQSARTVDEVEWLDTQPGTSVARLHRFEATEVRLVSLQEGTTFSERSEGGLECLVYKGVASIGEQRLTRWDWTRVPDGERFSLVAKRDTTIWLKTGHLRTNN